MVSKKPSQMVKGRVESKVVYLTSDVTQTEQIDLFSESGAVVINSLYASLMCFL